MVKEERSREIFIGEFAKGLNVAKEERSRERQTLAQAELVSFSFLFFFCQKKLRPEYFSEGFFLSFLCNHFAGDFSFPNRNMFQLSKLSDISSKILVVLLSLVH